MSLKSKNINKKFNYFKRSRKKKTSQLNFN